MAARALILASFCGSSIVDARSFLQPQVEKHDVEQAFLAELSGASSGERVAAYEAEFQPQFASLPKNDWGNLDNPTSRYVLHRHFVHNYGWHVKGLTSTGETLNSSTSPGILKSRVSSYIFELFESQLNGKGFNVKDLAVFAAVMEDVVHQEAISVVARIFELKKMSLANPVDVKELDSVMFTFTAAFTLGDFRLDSAADIKTIMDEVVNIAPHWEDVESWMRDVRETLEFAKMGGRNPFIKREYTFSDGVEIAKRIMTSLGRFDDAECKAIKSTLADMDPHGLGRVPVADYYASKEIQFHERMDYLRHMGILDETTNPKAPAIIIPNIIESSGNCAMVTDFYSVCCLDECEGLMRQVEAKIAAPSATPALIAEVVSSVGSDSFEAPRNLSTLLVSRLDEIAQIHGGQVQLHGRLFMQWMHHAYPRECKFPHVAGTVSKLSELDWADWAGMHDVMITEEEKAKLVLKDPEHQSMSVDAQINAIPWSTVEELVASSKPTSKSSGIMKKLRYVLGVSALVFMLLPMVRGHAKGSVSDDHRIQV